MRDYAKAIIEARSLLVATQTELRRAERSLAEAKVAAERRILEAAGGEKGLGPNEGAQKRALAAKVAEDEDYADLASLVISLEGEVATRQCALENAIDERRQWECEVRERLANALLGKTATEPADSPNHPEDRAFDVSADRQIDQETGEIVSGAPYPVTQDESPIPLDLDDIPF